MPCLLQYVWQHSLFVRKICSCNSEWYKHCIFGIDDFRDDLCASGRQKLLTKPLNQIVALKNQMQKDVNSSFYTVQFIALTVFRFSAPFNQCLSMLISVLPIFREGGAWVITCWLFLFLVVFAVAAIINLYYLGILCLWRVHEMNNQRLLTLVSKLKDYSDLRGTAKLRKVSMQRLCDASDTMDEIAETNSRIYFCGDHLRRALSFQTVAGFASTFVSCTIEIFCFYHFLWNITYLDPIYVFVTTWRILYEYLDTFLIANAADFANHASDQTRYLLHSHLDSVQISDKRLMKSVSCINWKTIVMILKNRFFSFMYFESI